MWNRITRSGSVWLECVPLPKDGSLIITDLVLIWIKFRHSNKNTMRYSYNNNNSKLIIEFKVAAEKCFVVL